MNISEVIRKIIEEWNPYDLEDSVYGIESSEIYKCIKGSNNSNKSNTEEIAFYIQRVLEGYAEGWNKEFSLGYEECLVIAKEITKVIERNDNSI